MRRRDFIKAIASSSVAWPLVVRAQQPTMPVIGFLNSGTREGFADFLAAFHQSLNQAGFVEGRNVAIEYRWAEGAYDRLPALAADLVRRRVTVIAATTTPAALAAKAATSVIPIIFTSAADPVAAGLVANLSRPGGNATGVTNYLTDLGAKRLELLHDVVPKVITIGMLVNPNYPDIELQRRDVEEAARKFGQQVHVGNAASADDFDRVLAALVRLNASALLVTADAVFLSRRDRLCGACGALRASCDLPPARLCAGRRPHELRSQCYGRIPPSRHLRGAGAQGRCAGRFTRGAAEQVRLFYQSKDR